MVRAFAGKYTVVSGKFLTHIILLLQGFPRTVPYNVRTTYVCGMATKKRARKEDRFELRISPDLKKRATKAAQAEGRTLAGHIIYLLEKSLATT